MATKRKKISVEDKMEVIKCFENGENNSEISQKFHLSSSTVSTILKNHKKIREAFENNQKSAKRLRKAEKADLDEALCKWLKRNKQLNGLLTRRMLVLQATKLATELGYKNFSCSHSWLDRFKNRHKVEYHTNVTSSRIVPAWLDNWENIKSGFSENDIFVLDSTEVTYKVTEDKPGENDEKNSEAENFMIHQSTIFLCVNMTGTEKRKLIVVESKKYDEILDDLPVIYFPDKKTSTPVEILKSEVLHWDREYQSSGRKILLLIGKPDQELETKLNNVEMILVPSDYKTVLHEVITNYHNHFRDLLLDYQINRRKSKPRTGYQLSCIEALNLLKQAWDKVKPETIKNCLALCGLTSESVDSISNTVDEKEITDETLVGNFEIPPLSADCSVSGDDPSGYVSGYLPPFFEDTNNDSEENNFRQEQNDERESQEFGIDVTKIKVEVECDVVKTEFENSQVSEEAVFSEISESLHGKESLAGFSVEKNVKTEPEWNATDENEMVAKVSLPEAQDAIQTLEMFYRSNPGVNPTFEIHLEKLRLIIDHFSKSNS